MRHVMDVLDKAKIAHQLLGDEGGFDVSTIGGGGNEPEKILNIRVSDYDAAREALEADSLKTDLPANHHLAHASDEELLDIMTHASEWSPFDVAHARRLLEEKGVDTAKLKEDREEKIARLMDGKPASKKLIFFGWVFCFLGGIIGIAIALSINQTKDKTPLGDYYRYDRASRTIGADMLKVGIICFFIGVFIRVYFKRS